ncbi:hypothetical protein APR41_14685 [Salegentibacter salinarum]|uniref:Outer membrane protein beta-barrel domain-containing protein n=1 Tax=Salegentibacter salinarum TaxID=447422 RepID=A0A2N0TZQ3_9FLAO|nr:hypothetical protein [Salegentibacter salinarum]PKD20225.1 hypothetical protein APR41_14685 [Salegentibacter salinarum]SKB87591.1 hypothetical protein SAMN05660903_02992 [Salegentibacter salinarum]
MKNRLFVLLFFLVISLISAQNKDNIENEILSYTNSQTQIISKGRLLLADSFLEGDLQKVDEVRNYLLKEVDSENYIALLPGEQWLISYWTGEFYDVIDSVNYYYTKGSTNYEDKIFPTEDRLYYKLVEKSWNELEKLEEKILTSGLNEEEKDFLLLHLNYMISGQPLNTLTQDEINKMADLFLEKHPTGKLTDLVKSNIRFRFEASNWGFAFDFFMGYAVQNGALSSQFSNGFALGHGFDVEYKKFSLYLRNYIGFTKTLEEMEVEAVGWQKDMRLIQYLPEASIGYSVVDNNKLKLSPFAGIGGVAFSPTESDINNRPELEDSQVGFVTAYTLGANLDFKLGWNTGAIFPNNKTYWFLRCRYGYTMPQMGSYPGYEGNIHYFNIGIGGVFRAIKRDI